MVPVIALWGWEIHADENLPLPPPPPKAIVTIYNILIPNLISCFSSETRVLFTIIIPSFSLIRSEGVVQASESGFNL